MLNALPLPWTVSIAQLGACHVFYAVGVSFSLSSSFADTIHNLSKPKTGLGAVYALMLWAIRVRKVPTIAAPEMKTLSVLGLFHAVSHITAITSLGAGAVRWV